MSDYIDEIETQYNEFPYPEPILNMPQLIEQGYQQGSCLKLIWQRLFPEKEFSDNLSVLIAGCGTNQAVYHALKYPRSQHYAIDVSQASLNHVKNMIKKYNITNLTVEKKDILELKEKNKFDYVVSTGVIHHTQNPQENLKRLVEATKDDGALFIMVYASYLRTGVYFLQDAFKYLGLKSNKEGIQIAEKLIQLSPKNHYAHNYLNVIKSSGDSSRDLTFDAGIVDTFFNARDVSYNVFELKNLIESSGAYFQNWYDNMFYYRKLFDFRSVEKLNETYMNLDHWELSDFTQKMNPNSGKFNFILRKNKKYKNRFFKIEELLPSTFVHKLNEGDFRKKNNSSEDAVSFDAEGIIWMNINNKIENILNKSNKLIAEKKPESQLSFGDLQKILHNYWKNGYIALSDK